MKIVFVHGRSQQGRLQPELESVWTEALMSGFRQSGVSVPSQMQIVLPFYGDDLFDAAYLGISQTSKDLKDRGVADAVVSTAEGKFLRDVVREMIEANGISSEDVAKEVGEDVVDRDIQNWKSVLAALRLLERIPGVSEVSIRRTTRDVWLYLTDANVRRKVDKLVEPAIPTSEPCVVVAHSLGSIVAYSILRKRRSCSNIYAFVTLGAPLGIKAIYSRLPPNLETRISPPEAHRWYNARDKQDAVALHEIPVDMYQGDPVVENYSAVLNGASNHHGIEDYLKDKSVARVIYEAFRAGEAAETARSGK